MTEPRQQRITQLLDELQQEITAGIVAGDVDGLSFWFYVPDAPDSATFCELRTETVPLFGLHVADLAPRLRFGP